MLVRKIQEYGNMLVIIFSDGSKQLAYPMSTGLWIVKNLGAPSGSGDFVYPFNPALISSAYQTPERPTHNGIDFSYSGINNAPISCAADGTVILVSDEGTYGNHCIVDHGTVSGVNVKTLYAHMIALPIVDVDDVVTKGQTLGNVGTTGLSTGPHLHWEVRIDDDFIDPEIFMLDYT